MTTTTAPALRYVVDGKLTPARPEPVESPPLAALLRAAILEAKLTPRSVRVWTAESAPPNHPIPWVTCEVRVKEKRGRYFGGGVERLMDDEEAVEWLVMFMLTSWDWGGRSAAHTGHRYTADGLWTEEKILPAQAMGWHDDLTRQQRAQTNRYEPEAAA